MSGPLRVERPAEGVVLLTLDLPDRRNAMTEELTNAWSEVVSALRGDPSVRAVVVTGAGRAFCAGGDLSWLAEGGDSGGPDRLRERMLPFYRTWLSIRSLEVPLLAAVNGAAVGAGLSLALACDLRYVAAGARLSVPFTSLGMHPGMATTFLLPEIVGLPIARELILTGRVVESDEALRIGLVNGVLPPAELVGAVVDTATRIAATAPVAARLTTVALRDGHRSFEQALQWEALAQGVTLATEDLREGLRAGVERRTPVFTGR